MKKVNMSIFAEDERSSRYVVKVDCEKKYYFNRYGYVLAFCAIRTDFCEVSIKGSNCWYDITKDVVVDVQRMAEVAAEYVDAHGDQISLVDDESYHDYMRGKFGNSSDVYLSYAASVYNVADYISVIYGYNIDEIIYDEGVPYTIILSKPVADPIVIDVPSDGITMAEEHEKSDNGL